MKLRTSLERKKIRARIKSLVEKGRLDHKRVITLSRKVVNLAISQSRLCGGQPGNGDPERGTTDIIKPRSVAEIYRGGIPAVLAAYANF